MNWVDEIICFVWDLVKLNRVITPPKLSFDRPVNCAHDEIRVHSYYRRLFFIIGARKYYRRFRRLPKSQTQI